MRIVAFDQATSKTGWAVIDDGRYKQSGAINHTYTKDINVRIEKMALEIYSVIDKSLADVVVIQDIYSGVNSSTFKYLAQLQGMILGYCFTYEYDHKIIAPSTWRLEMGFDLGRNVRRNYLKIQAVQCVYQNYGRHVTDDEADAVCIASAAYRIILAEEKKRKKEEKKNESKAQREKSKSEQGG